MAGQDIIVAEPSQLSAHAQKVQLAAQSMLAEASRAQIARLQPENLSIVDELIAQIDINDFMTIVNLGASVLKGRADTGLEILSALQVTPNSGVLAEVTKFQDDVEARMKPLVARYEAREESKRQRTFIENLAEITIVILDYVKGVTGKNTKKPRDDRALAEVTDVQEDAAILADVAKDTAEDAKRLQKTLLENRQLPSVIQEQIKRAQDAAREEAEGLYLALVAANEKSSQLKSEIIPSLEAKVVSNDALPEDQDALRQALVAQSLIETRRTDLTSAFVASYLANGMAGELSTVNAKSTLEMARIESIVLPQILRTLGSLALQQRQSELTGITIAGNKMMRRATENEAHGFRRVLEQSARADQAVLASMRAVAAAATTTIDALTKFREHEAQHAVDQATARGILHEAFGRLRAEFTQANRGAPATQGTSISLVENDTPAPPLYGQSKTAKGFDAT